MRHEIKDDIYYIYGDNDEELLKIQLYKNFAGDQIVISTKTEVYAGPIDLLSFAEIDNNSK